MIDDPGYWKALNRTFLSLLGGLKLTGRHILKSISTHKGPEKFDITHKNYFQNQVGLTTLQFPHEKMPVPENGRYKLHNEIDDCIVCDKCVKVCPVSCIEIDAIRSPEEIGKTSDGTSKRIYASKFDIDMSKCCFCGLCTTVCPTECLTMTPDYAYSTFDIRDHNFQFAEMTETEITQRKKEWEIYLSKKAESKTEPGTAIIGSAPRPVIKPIMKQAAPKLPDQKNND